eukprot:363375-Chlamydomonas_euryale.AAC.1
MEHMQRIERCAYSGRNTAHAADRILLPVSQGWMTRRRFKSWLLCCAHSGWCAVPALAGALCPLWLEAGGTIDGSNRRR